MIFEEKKEMENLALCVSCGLVTRPREQNHHIFHSGGDLVIETVFYVSHVLNEPGTNGVHFGHAVG